MLKQKQFISINNVHAISIIILFRSIDVMVKLISIDAGGLEFHSRAGLIGHSAPNDSSLLRRIFGAVLAIKYLGVSVWNSVPVDIRKCYSRSFKKKKIKKLLTEGY